MSELRLIAARLAAASQLFPLPHSDVDGRAVRDSTVHVEGAGDSLSICVTDHDGSKREYRAVVQLVSTSTPEKETAPDGSRC
ncbi:Uncharacterised protein [Mycobacteroides abscessus subsp. abscessus]|nr:Uncharacterised protein [Mycobacteroides abscessus subsp. abscessus]SKV14658.1 Uncharacterised protein [Mycobacteroides abscessus subsp. abscessus]